MNRPKEFLAWAVGMFGPVALHRDERAARFVEEAVELVHAEGLPVATVFAIVSRVYQRPAGDVEKEIGQAQATLECLAENLGINANVMAQREFGRVQAIPREEWDRRHAAKVALGIANLSNAT